MALNYQRNSYTLWEAATKTWLDNSTRHVFDPAVDIADLGPSLLKYKLALQPNKHVATWRIIAATIAAHYNGRITDFLAAHAYDIPQILNALQKTHKAGFPYLSGNKIGHYWLYVLTQYTGLVFRGREHLSIAPDTHVMQASQQLGISTTAHTQTDVVALWHKLLDGADYTPIDIHTPLWLWSRGGFTEIKKQNPHENKLSVA
jgi:hypothetical protein